MDVGDVQLRTVAISCVRIHPPDTRNSLRARAFQKGLHPFLGPDTTGSYSARAENCTVLSQATGANANDQPTDATTATANCPSSVHPHHIDRRYVI